MTVNRGDPDRWRTYRPEKSEIQPPSNRMNMQLSPGGVPQATGYTGTKANDSSEQGLYEMQTLKL